MADTKNKQSVLQWAGVWLHGEAVAAGMVMAAHLSYLQGWIERDILMRTQQLLQQAQLPTAPPAGMSPSDFMRLMAIDKKVVDGGLRLVLLRGPLGGCVISSDFSADALQDTLAEFCN